MLSFLIRACWVCGQLPYLILAPLEGHFLSCYDQTALTHSRGSKYNHTQGVDRRVIQCKENEREGEGNETIKRQSHKVM